VNTTTIIRAINKPHTHTHKKTAGDIGIGEVSCNLDWTNMERVANRQGIESGSKPTVEGGEKFLGKPVLSQQFHVKHITQNIPAG
jgi:hypothetical protein